MNSTQIGFLIFILLPIVLSPIVDVVTYRSKKASLWITWPEAMIQLYMIETIILVLVAAFVMMGM